MDKEMSIRSDGDMVELYEEDLDWQPPSESEMKLLQARRERSDKISKLMGDYLLKGYKMLGSVCALCDTILLQTKQGTNYCVACSELDSDADKDNPVTNQAAAMSLAREGEVRESASGPLKTASLTQQPKAACAVRTVQSSFERSKIQQPRSTEFVEIPLSENPIDRNAVSRQGLNVNACASSQGRAGDSQKYVQELLDKMDWAVGELRGTKSVEYSTQLCNLVKSCADAMSSVRAALD